MSSPTICQACGNRFSGNFCNNCGEKKFNNHEKSFRHFIGHSFHFLTHLDNKFLRSLALVYKRPGFLSAEITRGVRKKYFPPLNLFLIGVILYLIFPLLDGLNLSLSAHTQQVYKPIINFFIEQKIGKEGDFQKLAGEYATLAPKIAKPLLLIVIPLSALMPGWLFQSVKEYFYDHLTLSAEINTFYLFTAFLIIPLLDRLFSGIRYLFTAQSGSSFESAFVGWIFIIGFILYSVIIFRRFYRQNYLPVILKSILFLIWQMVVIIIYRIVHVVIVLLFI